MLNLSSIDAHMLGLKRKLIRDNIYNKQIIRETNNTNEHKEKCTFSLEKNTFCF